ncbi:MAG: 3-oxoacyl-[acyl-carrier-protein] reductase [Anaerolineae bacterium]|nr:3-oxoacyl-[acyl-carrier-protein] reductase [Anaerolineae bacterium]
MDLKGKTALVTGGSRGIGRAIAIVLARYGADVAVNYVRNVQAASECGLEIERAGQKAFIFQADVGYSDQAQSLVKSAVAHFGRVDILVNNAGITRDTLLARMSESDWDEVIRVNLKGVFNVTQALIRLMMRQRWGRIINISSISGLMGQVGQVNYAASKSALIGFTKSLAREVGKRGITANVIAPGYIPTDLNADLDQSFQDQICDLIPLGHFGKTDDVANVAAFLASESAAYITGAVVPVDGGLSM